MLLRGFGAAFSSFPSTASNLRFSTFIDNYLHILYLLGYSVGALGIGQAQRSYKSRSLAGFAGPNPAAPATLFIPYFPDEGRVATP
jgi:hypothetical protein